MTEYIENDYCPEDEDPEEELVADPKEEEAKQCIKEFFETNENEVFYTTQIKVLLEKKFYHWVTNRALRSLAESGDLQCELVELQTANPTYIYIKGGWRYYRRVLNERVKIIEEYMQIIQTEAVGERGEDLVEKAFSRQDFSYKGYETNEFEGKRWTETEHNLDFLFQRDSRTYGIEVKNTLPYISREEFDIKLKICEHLGVIPVFAVRMLPGDWIYELYQKGGFAIVLDYQFFPRSLTNEAKKIKRELRLPIDTPKSLEDGTMRRFLNNHHLKNL